MSDAVVIAIIGGIVSTVGLIIGGIIKVRLDNIHKQINSRMDELLRLTRESSEAKGVLKEKNDQANKTSL
jgi:ABC-type branched-subunit amino acid transport system permease subunit